MSPDLRQVFVYGRLRRLTRREISDHLVKNGGKLIQRPSTATAVVIGHAAALKCLGASGLDLPFELNSGACLLSELEFSRALGRSDQHRPETGPYRFEDLVRLSGLEPEICRALATFDVISPRQGSFGYQDLATAKQAAALLERGISLAAVIRAGIELGARGLRMSQFRLSQAPWGEVVQDVGGKLARLNGQFTLVLDEDFVTADACFDRAQRNEAEGDIAEAERWYRRAMMLDKADPAIPFNLGNVLAEQSRSAEAILAFRQALERDPSLAEAFFNLGCLFDGSGQWDEAVEAYRSTLALHPSYSQALYNLARLLTRQDRYQDALPVWDAFIELAPDDPDIRHARRLATLCRMEIRQSKAG